MLASADAATLASSSSSWRSTLRAQSKRVANLGFGTSSVHGSHSNLGYGTASTHNERGRKG